jgi:hypothetical protein
MTDEPTRRIVCKRLRNAMQDAMEKMANQPVGQKVPPEPPEGLAEHVNGCDDCRRFAFLINAVSSFLEALVEDKSEPESEPDPQQYDYWCLRFTDGSEPQRRLIGICFVVGRSLVEAITNAAALSINPGGDVEGYRMDPEELPPLDVRGRFLNAEEATALAQRLQALADEVRGAVPRDDAD